MVKGNAEDCKRANGKHHHWLREAELVAAVGLPLHLHQRAEWLSAVRSLGSVSAGLG